MTDAPIELRELMQLAGLTFKALGDRIGLNQARVFKALTGEITLRPEHMTKMEIAILDAARDRAARLAAVLGMVAPPEAMASRDDYPSSSGIPVSERKLLSPCE